MNVFSRLSKKRDQYGNVDLIANKTKKNYVNLGGINNQYTIDCIHMFLCRHKIWHEEDNVILTRRHIKFVPPNLHNISCVLKFYKAAIKAAEYRAHQEQARMENDKKIIEPPTSNVSSSIHVPNNILNHQESINDDKQISTNDITNITNTTNDNNHKQPITVHRLTNPNINHGNLSTTNNTTSATIDASSDITNDNKLVSHTKSKTDKSHKYYSDSKNIIEEESSSLDEVINMIDNNDNDIDIDIDTKKKTTNNKKTIKNQAIVKDKKTTKNKKAVVSNKKAVSNKKTATGKVSLIKHSGNNSCVKRYSSQP